MVPQNLVTYKLRYETTDEGTSLIDRSIRQYSSLLRCAYNRCEDGMKELDIKHMMKNLNNVGLMDSHMIACAAKDAGFMFDAISEKRKREPNIKLVFGGKKNLIRRCKGLITKDEYLTNRFSPLFSMGEANQKANRKFKINQDLHTITFQITRHNHAILNIKGIYGKRERVFSKLYELQEKKQIPISYKIDRDYVYVTFDETKVSTYERRGNVVNGRVMAIDMNPNYIGWSIVDWKSSSEFNVVKSGVFSIKPINDLNERLQKDGTSSEDQRKIYVNNKRTFEVYEVSKKLVDICLYYKCEMFSMEDISIPSSNGNKGKLYNRLVNNCWNRDKLVNNLTKRCNLFQIKLLKVKPEYSSFIGNFLFRSLGLPDMVLASIEIGRRGYEFNEQYIEKKKEIKRNIIKPDLNDFRNLHEQSLEEFGLQDANNDLVGLYHKLKNTGTRYRVSLDDVHVEFSRCFSERSLILKTIN